MRRAILLLALFLAPLLGNAQDDPFIFSTVSIGRNFVGPLELKISDKLPPLSPTATAQLVILSGATPPAALVTKAASLTAPASFIFSLAAGDAALAPAKYRATLDVTDGERVYPYHGTVEITGFPTATVVVPNPAARVLLVSPGAAFTSIADANAAIPDASASKPYIIQVGPGSFPTPPFTLKPYVEVMGLGYLYSSKIVCTDQTQHCVRMSPASTVRQIAIRGPSCTDCAAFDFQGTGYDPAVLYDVTCESGDTCAWSHPATYGVMHAHFTVNRYTGTAMRYFLRASDHGVLTGLGSSSMSGPPGAVGTAFSAVGQSASLTLDSGAARNATTGVFANDGAYVRLSNVRLNGGTYAIHVGPDGSGTTVEVGAKIANFSSKDIWVESATASVPVASGIANALKIDAPPDTVWGAFTDTTSHRLFSPNGLVIGTGTVGCSFTTGHGIPSAPERDCSWYADLDSGNWYQRKDGSWSLK